MGRRKKIVNEFIEEVDEDGVVQRVEDVADDLEDEEITEQVVDTTTNTEQKIENPETEILTSEYTKKEVSEEDSVAAKLLNDTFTSYLTNTTGIGAGADDNVRNTIPTGIDVLDAILGGGAATKLFQVAGQPGAGKSALAARIIANGQKKWPGKFVSIYIDSEQAMSKTRLAQLGVTNPPIEPTNVGITVEKIFKVIDSICTFKETGKADINVPTCIVWDSVANTLTDKGMDEENVHSVLGQKAAILSHMLPRYVDKLNKYNICFLCVNQLRDKIQMGITHTPSTLRFLSDKNLPGGNSLLYNSFQLITCRQSTILNDEYGFSGVKVTAKTIKNKLFTPNLEVDLIFSFEHGFSNFWTNYEFLKKTKRLTAGGGWVQLNGYTSGNKCRQHQAIGKYKTDPEFREAWNAEVKDAIKTEFLDKYQGENSEQAEIWD